MLIYVLMKRTVRKSQDLKIVRPVLMAWVAAAMLLLSACMESTPSAPVPEQTTPPIGTERQPDEILPEPEVDGPMLADASLQRPIIRC